MANCSRTNAPGLVIGFCLMAVGALLLADRLGLLVFERAIAFWPLALVLFGASLIVQAIRGGESGGRGFPLGAVVWVVLIGLFFTNIFDRFGSSSRGRDAGREHLFAVLSGDRRAPMNETFRGAEMTSLMGGTVLDLTRARMAPGEEAVIDVFALMGGAVVHVPRDWKVDLQTTAVMGGVKDERFEAAEGVPGRFGRRGARRQGDGPRGGWDIPEPPDPAELPALPEFPRAGALAQPPAPAAPPETPGAPAPPAPDAVEREDPVPPPNAPRLVLRGFVMMGGLVVKS